MSTRFCAVAFFLNAIAASAAPFDNDLAIYDRALAEMDAAKSDSTKFGDVSITRAQLLAFRSRLTAQKNNFGPQPNFLTPSGTTFLWLPSGGANVHYQFDPTQTTGSSPTITAAKMQQFRDSIGEWAAFANLHFTEFSGTPPNPDYITVSESTTIGEGGYSDSVGRKGGEQHVQFSPNAWNRGTICHEVGHALGLWHEQQRPDRDMYVTIDYGNIASGNQANFAIIPDGVTHGTYDFYSVMEYSRNALAINPAMDTITMKSGFTQYANIIGNVPDRTLSKLDRAGMAQVYGNPTVTPSATVTNTKDSGAGSLRTAVYYAFDRSTDAPPTPTTVTFHIPTSDPNYNSSTGVFTISPTFQMVAPGAGTTIDGSTQTSFTGDTNPTGPEILINGSQIAAQNLSLFASGLILREMSCTIKNLTINGFNEQGILFDGTTAATNLTTASGNIVIGCYIGTNPTGTVAVGNGSGWAGIEMVGGGINNTIGGLTTAARNIISGNSGHGIAIHDAGTTGNLIEGNYIGTNAAGTGAVANNFAGVAVYGGATSNTLGGLTSSARNIISGNTDWGVAFSGTGTNGNVALGNYIGLNAAGNAAVTNGNANFATDTFYPGVEIYGGAKNNTIGGTVAGAANVISGNTAQGVILADSGTTGNLVQGNFIGTNPAGTSAIANGNADPGHMPYPYIYSGVSIFGGASGNTIGGLTSGAANLLSGNIAQGVTISDSGTSGNLVAGNLIGTNLAGTGAIPNGYAGVSIFNTATANTIGGLTSSARNIISGNTNQGVTISDDGTNANLIQGNYIGTNLLGNGALANAYEGVAVFGGASANYIGGSVAGAGNVISGNSARGVGFFDAATNGNFVQGNLIGLNAAGTAAIANAYSGVESYLASGNTIGGTSPGARNYISGNGDRGVLIDGASASGNLVQGNTIGLTRSGTAAPNGTQGVEFFTGAHLNTIGGTTAGASNQIANNSGDGIRVYDSGNDGTNSNALLGNSIFSNTGLGIDLLYGNINGTQHPNNGQAAPTLTSAVLGSMTNVSGTDITWQFSGANSTLYHFEFFASPSSTSQGKNLISSTNVTTNSSGSISFSPMHLAAAVPIAPVQAGSSVVTATATDPNGNTSQFSGAVTVSGLDSDSDGIPDNWMMAHFNHATGQAADKSRATDDADGDGLTNLQEYLAGTDPTKAATAFHVSSVVRNAGNVVITFASVAGKTYRLDERDDLTQTTWTVLEDQVLATSSSTSFTDASGGLTRRFYRVTLEP